MILNYLYRWCDGNGGGLVIANSKEEAKEKLVKKYGAKRDADKFIIWSWTNDEYYDEENPHVLDIY